MSIEGVTSVGEGKFFARRCVRVSISRLTSEVRRRVPLSIEGYDVVLEKSEPVRVR
jgi:hypothetical protein